MDTLERLDAELYAAEGRALLAHYAPLIIAAGVTALAAWWL